MQIGPFTSSGARRADAEPITGLLGVSSQSWNFFSCHCFSHSPRDAPPGGLVMSHMVTCERGTLHARHVKLYRELGWATMWSEDYWFACLRLIKDRTMHSQTGLRSYNHFFNACFQGTAPHSKRTWETHTSVCFMIHVLMNNDHDRDEFSKYDTWYSLYNTRQSQYTTDLDRGTLFGDELL
jgi:hypothetical protein